MKVHFTFDEGNQLNLLHGIKFEKRERKREREM
jgi:hypothetical protein